MDDLAQKIANFEASCKEATRKFEASCKEAERRFEASLPPEAVAASEQIISDAENETGLWAMEEPPPSKRQYVKFSQRRKRK